MPLQDRPFNGALGRGLIYSSMRTATASAKAMISAL